MPIKGLKRGLAVLCVALLFALCGCQTPVDVKEEFVLSAGSIGLTSADFSRELDLKLSAYPYGIKDQPNEYNRVVMELLSELSEQYLLLAAADQAGVQISQEELDTAEAEFKLDYPEDSFEQMLLDTATPYLFWKQKLKQDLIIQKLIQSQLLDKIEISAEDIKTFYQDSENSDAALNDENAMIRSLRLEKSQARYQEWIKGVKNNIQVTLNQEAVAGFLSEPQLQKKEDTK